MGNTDSANLDAARAKSEQKICTEVLNAIESNDVSHLQQMIEYNNDRYWINAALNKEGDTALIYATKCRSVDVFKALLKSDSDVQARNKLGDTALAISVKYFCTNMNSESHLDVFLLELLKYGAVGPSLSQLILYFMEDNVLILDIINSLPNYMLEKYVYYKCSGLLLQSTVWFDQRENFKRLLQRGACVQAYWDVPFMPQITPNTSFNYQDNNDDEDMGGSYSLESPESDQMIQQTKLSLVHDWRDDWNDGENPEAIFRAGLHLPYTYLNLFIRTAASQQTYVFLAQEIFKYPPITSGGPLVSTNSFKLLVSEGYIFTEAEQRYLKQKYNITDTLFETSLVCQSLKHCCRYVIRGCAKFNVLHLIEQLSIPLPLKIYLLLGDIDENEESNWLLN